MDNERHKLKAIRCYYYNQPLQFTAVELINNTSDIYIFQGIHLIIINNF